MKSNRILSLLLILLIGLATGCQSTAVENSTDTKTITDCLGREVVIPADPQRVACLYASTAHIMAMLDQEDKIVGIPNGIKRDVLMSYKRPDIVDVSVPYSDGSINVEELLATNTDLALIRQSTALNEGETQKLDKAGIPWVVIDYASIDELKTAITVCGLIFSQEVKADAYINDMESVLALVAERVSIITESERTKIYHAVNEDARTDLTGDICSEITQIAGTINVSTEGGNLFTESEKTMTTLEQIYLWNPDAIIANDINTTNYILNDSKWTGLSAVANKQVYTLPVGVTRWGHPGSIEPHMAALFIAKLFYPDLFTDIDLMEKTRSYYQEMFGLSLSDDDINSILSGSGMRISK
ncbi:ABC transporter substrate-binding protein [Eubacteriaceae bacterium ES3]|nr:ABC transporter substrate-binding protein [Eubacteriaceae bacterium ES3]